MKKLSDSLERKTAEGALVSRVLPPRSEGLKSEGSMDTIVAEVQQDRKGFIGGSDIAAVMGLSRWVTPLQLWAEKTGEVAQKDLSDNEAVRLGKELEDFVAQKFARETGRAVRRAPKIYVHPVDDFMRCQVDRLITGTDELLEVKTANAFKAKEWEGEEIPTEYILQVMWQLGITGRSVGWIAVLIGGQAFRYKRIEFDAELFAKMVEQARVFWQMVRDRVAPMAMAGDKETLLALFPQELNEEMLQSYQEMENDIARRMELKMHIEEMAGQVDEIDNRLRQVIGENLGIRTERYVVKNKRQKTAPKVRFDQMREDGVYELYTQENFTRVLRVAVNKPGGANE